MLQLTTALKETIECVSISTYQPMKMPHNTLQFVLSLNLFPFCFFLHITHTSLQYIYQFFGQIKTMPFVYLVVFVSFTHTVVPINIKKCSLNSWCTISIALITPLITVSPKPSFVTLALVIWHTNAMTAWFLACQTLLAYNFTVIAAQTFRTTAFIVANAFPAIHARYNASCWNRNNRFSFSTRSTHKRFPLTEFTM